MGKENRLTSKSTSDLVIDAYVLKYIPEYDEVIKREFCAGCIYRSKKCFKCKAAQIFSYEFVNALLVEKSTWN